MYIINFIVSALCINMSSAIMEGCVEPPMECPNENVTFWLYTRANQNNPHQLFALKPESITSAPFVKDAPIKIIIHGYTKDRNSTPNTELRPAYMECCDYNLISVDYNPIARDPCYIQAARNTELVGMCTAQLVDEMVKNYNFSLSKIHPIGFSLGGQIVGFIGNYMTSGRFERSTGLDPALPLFATSDNRKKLDSGDAKFVDVLHTNALEKGKLEPSGTVDFFANGGMMQPGCKTSKDQTASGCNHARAPAYYAESINSQTGFYAKQCPSWITYAVGWCELTGNSDEEILFGEYVPLNATGVYFFTTNSEPPYARGRNN
ncbi:pancreatic triacylglycerol lipase-like [Hyposmocoma kahamanoa]|uniref:pancreatic triacylglycerol lipase-like n=1 Tax=Hyposmocoma kahamanoa TaxID=1477025 RepID=UPI000E6D8DA4|nr:pancreatic triacylglycerol lipase-like [Hyposmocoma kahamanoa]